MSSSSFKDFVLDQLAKLADLDCKRMFGGYGLYQDGTFFGIIFKDQLYFKTSDASRPDYLKRGSGPFRPNAKQTLKTYFTVPAEILEDHGRLVEWAKTAVLAAKT